VVSRYAAALKPGAPFVFTYHHNDLSAYTPLVVALLDAELTCSQTLPAAAEMEASLHIAKTASSILDTVFVCRAMLSPATAITAARLRDELVQDCIAVAGGGVNASQGDVRCLALGHLARATISELRPEWNRDAAVEKRLSAAQQQLRTLAEECGLSTVWEDVCHALSQTDHIVATPDVAHHA
jgi:adenine-specific DNA methylase